MSAFLGPVWHWIDPFTTIHDLGRGRAAGRRVRRLGRRRVPRGDRALAGDRRLRLLRLARARRQRHGAADAVHRHGRLHRLHAGDDGPVRARRLAPRRRDVPRLVRPARADRAVRPRPRPADDRVARRPFASALLLPGWHFEDLVLVALGTASILFDGLSQTQPWFDVFGAPGVPIKTLQLLGFLGLIVGGALSSCRGSSGLSATAAGPAADRGRLPRRPLLHVPADRRPADRRRPRRPAPAGLGHRRLRLRRSSSRRQAWLPPGLRLDGPARGGRRRPHARRLGRPLVACTIRRGPRRRSSSAAAGAARGDHGRPDDADALVARARRWSSRRRRGQAATALLATFRLPRSSADPEQSRQVGHRTKQWSRGRAGRAGTPA